MDHETYNNSTSSQFSHSVQPAHLHKVVARQAVAEEAAELAGVAQVRVALPHLSRNLQQLCQRHGRLARAEDQ
jgi:hypothetical protein